MLNQTDKLLWWKHQANGWEKSIIFLDFAKAFGTITHKEAFAVWDDLINILSNTWRGSTKKNLALFSGVQLQD